MSTDKIIERDGMEFVYIEAGEFDMGSPDSDEKRRCNECPQHRVKISRGFWMSRYLVTQGQWRAVMGKNPSFFPNEDNYPVENISWDDVQLFVKKLNLKNCGLEIDSEQVWHEKAEACYRLPTEAEWEYACRAGTKTPYSWGDDASLSGEYAWYYMNSDKMTQAVGKKAPNLWGLYDMHGNVWEWVLDWYDANYKKWGAECTDPVNLNAVSGRIFRGGSWSYDERALRSTSRVCFSQENRGSCLGFRLVLIGGRDM